MSTTALEAAKSVNALMSFSGGDQDALLDVLGDYFSSPCPEMDDSEDDDSDEDQEGNYTMF